MTWLTGLAHVALAEVMGLIMRILLRWTGGAPDFIVAAIFM